MKAVIMKCVPAFSLASSICMVFEAVITCLLVITLVMASPLITHINAINLLNNTAPCIMIIPSPPHLAVVNEL